MSDEDDRLDPDGSNEERNSVPPEIRARPAQGKRVIVFESDEMSDGMFHADPRAFCDTDE
jgi:hypothetical protein